MYIFILFFIIIPVLTTIFMLQKFRLDELNDTIYDLYNNSIEITPHEFYRIKKTKSSYYNEFNCEGVYVLHNKSKDLYYVGKSIKVFNRVNNHFTGSGNGDVYADYKYGDVFSIRIIELTTSPFNTLNELERHAIRAYNAYTYGYNKTRGNRG